MHARSRKRSKPALLNFFALDTRWQLRLTKSRWQYIYFLLSNKEGSSTKEGRFLKLNGWMVSLWEVELNRLRPNAVMCDIGFDKKKGLYLHVWSTTTNVGIYRSRARFEVSTLIGERRVWQRVVGNNHMVKKGWSLFLVEPDLQVRKAKRGRWMMVLLHHHPNANRQASLH
jgi:hypothetical protein